MSGPEIRFISGNTFKLREATEILASAGISVISVDFKVEELQTASAERLIKDKMLKAFNHVGRPLFVEHTGLYLDYLKGLPGGLTQIFWDTLEADLFAQRFGSSSDPTVVAKTVIGYTDTRNMYTFEGEVKGTIARAPRGPRNFQWDCVFIPDGYSDTFAELGTKKNQISMRRIALDKFAIFLTNRGGM